MKKFKKSEKKAIYIALNEYLSTLILEKEAYSINDMNTSYYDYRINELSEIINKFEIGD